MKDLLLAAAAHLFRLRVLKLLNECAEKSGSPERLLMCDLPMEHMNRVISLLSGNRKPRPKQGVIKTIAATCRLFTFNCKRETRFISMVKACFSDFLNVAQCKRQLYAPDLGGL